MSLQTRPPKLSSPTKRMVELTPEELENETPVEALRDSPEELSSLSDAPTLVASPSQFELSPCHDIPTVPKEVKSLLSTFPLFSGIGDSSEFIEEVSKVLHMRKYSIGDVVIRQGSYAKAMFFIVKGTLKVMSEDGEVVIVGEIGIMFDVQRTATVIAKTPCTLLTLTKEEVNNVLANYPDVKKSMKSAAQARIHSLVKEYEKIGKKITDEMKQISELGVEADISVALQSPSKLRTITADMNRESSVKIEEFEEEVDEYKDENDTLPEIKVSQIDEAPLSIAGALGRKLQEKRRASVAVWSDDKLMLFAQNVVSQNQQKESRLGKTGAYSQASMYSAASSIHSLEERLQSIEKIGVFSLPLNALVEVMRMVDLPTLCRFRACNKFLNSVVLEKEFQLLSTINLTVYNKKINDITLGQFLAFAGSSVQSLILKNCWALTDGGLAHIIRLLPRLTHLDLSSVWELTDNGLFKIAEGAPLLNQIDLSNCRKITDAGILVLLQHAVNLAQVNFSYCKNLTGKMMNHITWSNMQKVNLQRCTGIHDNGFLNWTAESNSPDVISLSTLSFALEDLNLSDCSFLGDATLEVISKKCPQLKRLCLSFCCSLTEKFAQYLTEGCPFLEVLDLSYCGGAVTDQSMLTLSQGLPRLKVLGLRGCVQVSDRGMEHLATHAINLNTINFTQCKNVSPNICKKLGINWNCVSQSVYHEGREVAGKIRQQSNIF